ncbi:MAG: glycosyltransferase family 1 protein [Erysipelotrichaceae bacterium]|nr:glycosyltransferase family 1 protein [Erysipelotrichaceae bacterium]
MKVLVGSLSRNFGGVESLFLNLVRYKKPDDFQMDFVCTDSAAAREDDFLACGSKVIHIPRPSKKIKKFRTAFQNVLSSGEYSIYHVNLTRFRFPLDVMIAKASGVKVILHCHSTQIYASGKKTTQLIRNIEQVLFRPVMMKCSDLNLACSRNAGEYLFGKQDFTVLPNGIDTAAFAFNREARDRIRDEFNLHGKKVIGHIGRFSPEKNHKFLIQLIDELVKKDSSYVMLCIGDGGLFQEIQSETALRNLQKHVILTGVRSDIPDLLSAMDLFVFPSLHEALPVTLIEAQANGLPCIISDYVTDEIDIIDLRRMSLKEGAAKWAEAVRAASLNRFEMRLYRERLMEFDIHRMTEKLADYYRNV